MNTHTLHKLSQIFVHIHWVAHKKWNILDTWRSVRLYILCMFNTVFKISTRPPFTTLLEANITVSETV